MDLMTLDAETFYDDDYTLKKLNTEAYIRDARFEELMWSIKFNDTKTFWIYPDRAEHFFRTEVDWANTTVIAHHAHFDVGILSFRHNVRPAFILDTLSMARVIDGPKAGNSLGVLSVRHGVGHKGFEVEKARGKHFKDFTRREFLEYAEYCMGDTDLTYKLAMFFVQQLPYEELELIDATVRMFTEPVFVGDQARLAAAVVNERQRKIALLTRVGLICPACNGAGTIPSMFNGLAVAGSGVQCKLCDGLGVNKKPLTSREKFADLLREFGIEPETKHNAKGDPTYAFARTDPFMQGLLDDAEEEVRFLAEARIGVTSNIVETRAQRYLETAQRGSMPVYTAHAAAHTLRCGGGDKMNWLNLSNKNQNRPEMAELKNSVHAPEGCMVVAADSSQGEARLLGWQAGQHDNVEAFRQGRDVYSEDASIIYGRHVDRRANPEDKIPGQVGKISRLSLGFGAGWESTSRNFLKGVLGAPPIQFKHADMTAMGIDPSKFLNNPYKVGAVERMASRLEMSDRLIHCIVSEHIVNTYRRSNQAICGVPGQRRTGYWGLLEHVIDCMIAGTEFVFAAHGILRTGKECIYLPPDGRLKLNYRGLQRSEDGEASYFDGRKRTKIYGSLLAENITQCLHRLIVGEQLLTVKRAGVKVALWTYDEIAVVVPESAAELTLKYMIEVMKTPPAWAVGLPLAAEGGIGKSYGDV